MTLKLLALDDEDLQVVSAHMQDAVFKCQDLQYLPSHKQFAIAANRFAWEETENGAKPFERRRSALVFKQVKGVKSAGFDRKKGDAVLSLLAMTFDRDGDGPDGAIELVLAGGGSILLDVDCIEVQLADTGGAWETKLRPRHPGAA
ncbi:MAG: DUF2948 family protein [Rhizobium sp.]|nr:DUF2948 family protein [Rhizobium sp.]